MGWWDVKPYSINQSIANLSTIITTQQELRLSVFLLLGENSQQFQSVKIKVNNALHHFTSHIEFEFLLTVKFSICQIRRKIELWISGLH